MKINGQRRELKERISLEEFLIQEGYEGKRVALERNGEIVPKEQYKTVILDSEDILEIVTFVGGG